MNRTCARYGISGAAWASVASYSVAAVLACGLYVRLSGNSLVSVVVPRREDLVLLRRVAASLVGRRGSARRQPV